MAEEPKRAKGREKAEAPAQEEPAGGLKVMGKIDLDAQKPKKKAKPAAAEAPAEEESQAYREGAEESRWWRQATRASANQEG